LGITLVLPATQPRRLALWELAVTVFFGALGWRYLRQTPLVFFATAPMVAMRLTKLAERGIDARAVLVTVLASAMFISRVPPTTFISNFRAGDIFPSSFFSQTAIAFIRERGLQGPVFNSNNLGGWLAWKLYPQVRVFQDSRMQATPPEHVRRILDATSQEAWDSLVGGVDWAVVSTPRVNQLSGVGRFPVSTWATVYWDDAIEIVARRAGRYRTLAAEREYRIVTSDSSVSTLLTALSSPSGAQIIEEARWNRADNPRSFVSAAVLCVAGESAACDDVDRLARSDRSRAADAALVRIFRKQ